jgi:hypothetical protein
MDIVLMLSVVAMDEDHGNNNVVAAHMH